MLTFISFWRAAAIVLNDLASSAYYAGGEASSSSVRQPVVHSRDHAPLLRRFPVIRGKLQHVRPRGVYRVVKEAMGGTLAKFSVSALMLTTFLPDRSVVSRRQVSCWIAERGIRLCSSESSFERERCCHDICHGCHPLFLVAEHKGHPRIE